MSSRRIFRPLLALLLIGVAGVASSAQAQSQPKAPDTKTKATPELLKSLNPDEVVVAVGAVRTMPPIPGNDRPNVFSGDEMRHLVLGDDLDALKGKTSWTTRLAAKAGVLTGVTKSPEMIREATKAWMPLGEHIVIIGGELVGLQLAEFLAERGRKVTVVDEAPRLGAGIYIVRRWRALSEARDLGVTLLPGMKNIAIGNSSASPSMTRTASITWSRPIM